MLAGWWLVVAGLPIFTQPLPEAPNRPSIVALASGQVSLREPCYRLVCGDAEWLPPLAVARPARNAVPGAIPRIEPTMRSRLTTRRYIPLHSPATRREWFYTRGDAVRVDTNFGIEAVRSPQTKLQVELGTGYRLQPYTDYGTAVAGPIARGQLQFSQQLGDRAELDQRVQWEKGRENAFIRQTVGLDLKLYPQWTLRSDLELRHDTAAGRTDREGSVELHYTF